jgi:hypothetical protein
MFSLGSIEHGATVLQTFKCSVFAFRFRFVSVSFPFRNRLQTVSFLFQKSLKNVSNSFINRFNYVSFVRVESICRLAFFKENVSSIRLQTYAYTKQVHAQEYATWHTCMAYTWPVRTFTCMHTHNITHKYAHRHTYIWASGWQNRPYDVTNNTRWRHQVTSF